MVCNIFKPKIQIWVEFGWSCKGRRWYILWPLGLFWYILWPFGIFYGHLVYIFYGHLVYFWSIWYIFSRFGMLYQEKSGNPARAVEKTRDIF
jgi:hypothetical protein